MRYGERPALLREELEEGPRDPVVVIDEIQKVPPLYEQVQWLVENRGRVFAMSGSSSRALRALPAGRVARFDLFGLTSAEIGRRLRPRSDAQPRLPPAALPGRTPRAAPARLRPELHQGGGAAAGPDPEPAGLLGLPDARRPGRHRARQLRDDRPRVRRLGADGAGVLPGPGGHAPGPLPAGLHEAPEAAGDRRSEVLFRRRRDRQRARRPGRPRPGLGALRQGLRELGVPRADGRLALPRALPRPGLLAPGERDRGRLRDRRHAVRGGGQGRRPRDVGSPQRAAPARRGPAIGAPARRGVARARAPA